MTELETLERARLYMEKLANGINPIDGSAIADEEVVNNVRLSRCFFYVADVLRQVIDNGGTAPKQKSKKAPFSLPIEKRKEFSFSDTPITISEIVRRINDLVPSENMKKLSSKAVLNWLVSIGVLTVETTATGKTARSPTPQGAMLGFSVAVRNGLNGQYTAVLYNREAQQFLLDNIDAAIEANRQKTES